MTNSNLDEALDQYEEPLHDLIEELLWEHFVGDDEDMAVSAMAVRRQRLERKRKVLKEEISALKENVEAIDAEIAILENVGDDIAGEQFDHLLKKVKSLSANKRDPSNDAIQQRAKQAGLPPQYFIELLNERYPVEDYGASSGVR